MLAAALLLSALAAILIPNRPRTGQTPGSEPEVELAHAELALVAGGTVVGDESE